MAAEETEPTLASEFIEDIGNLFLIEREIKKRTAQLPETEACKLTTSIRQHRSVPIVNRLGERAMRVRLLPKSRMATAIRYLSNHWEGLTLFLKEPAVPMTTNRVEFELRAIGLGRNNHFGSRSEIGAKVSANLYSLVESTKLNGATLDQYLLHSLSRHYRGQAIPLPHEALLVG